LEGLNRGLGGFGESVAEVLQGDEAERGQAFMKFTNAPGRGPEGKRSDVQKLRR
jgi:hypothetical protein